MFMTRWSEASMKAVRGRGFGMRAAVSALVLTAPLAAWGHAAALGDCNQLVAAPVDATVKEEGGSRTCGVGLVIFGVGGSIWGEKCPKIQHKSPAHQVCKYIELPVPAVFHCQKQGELPVFTRENDCGGAVLPYIEVGIPTSCIHGPWIENGHLEDFETVTCPQQRDAS